MPARFVDLDRQTPMFLPYDLREWVPAGHIAHVILEAVEQIPTAHFRIHHRGSGREQDPPTMLLAWLIYCYATGRFGSRTVEAASYSDVAVRYLCANHHPDHDTICAFRTANEAAFKAAFVTVRQMAQHLRLTKLGTVRIDGTKIQADASKHAAVSHARAGELLAQLELEVQELMARAQQAEHQETKEQLHLPAELTRRRGSPRRVAAGPPGHRNPRQGTGRRAPGRLRGQNKPSARRSVTPGKNRAAPSQNRRAPRPIRKPNTTSLIRTAGS